MAIVLLLIILILFAPWVLYRGKKQIVKPWLAGTMVFIVADLMMAPFVYFFLIGNESLRVIIERPIVGILVSSLLLVIGHLLVRWIIFKGILRNDKPLEKHQIESFALGHIGVEGLLTVGITLVQQLLLIQMINHQQLESFELNATQTQVIIEQMQALPLDVILATGLILIAGALVYTVVTWIFIKGLYLKKWGLILASLWLELLYFVAIKLGYTLFESSWVLLGIGFGIAFVYYAFMIKIKKEKDYERL